jgi:hypothetical protein
VYWLESSPGPEILPIAIWSAGQRLRRGEYLAVRGRSGTGAHHGEAVFYIDEVVDRW